MNFVTQTVMIPKYIGDPYFEIFIKRIADVLGGQNYIYHYVIADIQGFMNCTNSTTETLRILKNTTSPEQYYPYMEFGDYEQQFKQFSVEFTYCVNALNRFFLSSPPFQALIQHLKKYETYIDIGHVDTDNCFILASLTL